MLVGLAAVLDRGEQEEAAGVHQGNLFSLQGTVLLLQLIL